MRAIGIMRWYQPTRREEPPFGVVRGVPISRTSTHLSIRPPQATAAISQPFVYLEFGQARKKSTDDKSGAFKPRKINNKFRDRAAERREGVNGYFAEVLLLKPYWRILNNEQRVKTGPRGGDGNHSILVKRLDFALLQANKARAGSFQEEGVDTAVKEAFVEAASSSTAEKLEDVASPSAIIPRGRTREEAIEELKRIRAKRHGGSLPTESNSASDIEALEQAKKKRQFLPSADTAALEENVQTSNPTSRRAESPPPTSTVTIVTVPPVPPTLLSATIPQDASDTDIFAGAGDYEGLDLGGGDEDADDPPVGRTLSEDVHVGLVRPRWFGEDGDEALPNSPGPSRPQAAKQADGAEDRLVPSNCSFAPLATSAPPSIKDLEFDKAAEVHEKKKARGKRIKLNPVEAIRRRKALETVLTTLLNTDPEWSIHYSSTNVKANHKI
ncbi:hypothetical protein BS47DRAFT_1358594 [Hydnum rufescens UP504]|uniref:Uncharacterized protein n=1 Tax=Hydnum rufescens UP504 TaxID=1448309 RepID=A0A9P6B738_9AGAM|nr:hypothetical protein BS47DRAFT_1358594 [Hydnum rufescens UP504]